MTVRRTTLNLTFSLLTLFSFALFLPAFSSDKVSLYTPYTKISVSPGESVNYSIDLINDGNESCNEEIRLTGIPKGWSYTMKSGGYTVNRIALLPGGRKEIALKVDVPFQVNKGNYTFKVLAGDAVTLPITLSITEKGSNQTEFATDQANMQGNANSTFSYRATLKNRTSEKQLYALMADQPRGWNLVFKVNYKQVTSVEMEPNTTQEVNIDLTPSGQVEAKTYKIPVRAVTSTTSANMELEAVVTGSYSLELITPSGLVSTKISAGNQKKIQLLVRNTGSSELRDIELKSATPRGWEVLFDPKKIDRLTPGSESTVYATLEADKKAIPGDYVCNLEARTPEASSKLAYRVLVKTPLIMGWLGMLIILAAIGGVVYLFRKFGRR